jgi:hypothetical protein
MISIKVQKKIWKKLIKFNNNIYFVKIKIFNILIIMLLIYIIKIIGMIKYLSDNENPASAYMHHIMTKKKLSTTKH